MVAWEQQISQLNYLWRLVTSLIHKPRCVHLFCHAMPLRIENYLSNCAVVLKYTYHFSVLEIAPVAKQFPGSFVHADFWGKILFLPEISKL
jgi:hypothetical protein